MPVRTSVPSTVTPVPSMNALSESRCDGCAMVGRERELLVLRQAIDAARAGRGRLMVVEGAPGSGKTRLVREAAAEARRQDFRVVWLPPRGDGASAVVEAALDDAARGQPVVIVGDAIDHGSSDSLACIAGDLWRLPVLALVTKTASPVPVDERASEAESERHVTRLRLRPLRPGAMIALAARMGAGTSIPVLERLHAATGGNALLVVETIAAFDRAEAAADPEPWPLSERATLWMRARLDALSPAGRDAVEVASVLGDECDVTLVAQLAGVAADPSRVRTALGESAFTVSQNGGKRCRFVPPLARELIYASLSAERRVTLHAGAAVALAANGTTSPAVVVHRSLAACAAGDGRRCEYYLSRLVKEHTVRGAPPSPSGRPYFLREGEHWAIGFGDRTIRLNDRAGLLYLARLLSRPGADLAALALGERLPARNGSESASREPTLAAERARVRVTRRIRDGIDRIARAHPELGAHLAQTIRTGVLCAYVVDAGSAPRWEVRWS
jgi:hypothetical protein